LEKTIEKVFFLLWKKKTFGLLLIVFMGVCIFSSSFYFALGITLDGSSSSSSKKEEVKMRSFSVVRIRRGQDTQQVWREEGKVHNKNLLY
jgi:hypothetical protein